MIQRGSRLDLMPVTLDADISLHEIPYVEKYTNPITAKQHEIALFLAQPNIKISASAGNDYAEDRLQVTHEATTSYPRINISHEYNFWPAHQILPVFGVIIVALQHLPTMERMWVDITGRDHKDNNIKMGTYRYDVKEGILYEDTLSQTGWLQLLDWKADKPLDWADKDPSSVLTERLLHNTTLRISAAYRLREHKHNDRLIDLFYPIEQVGTYEDYKRDIDVWRHVAGAVHVMTQFLKNN